MQEKGDPHECFFPSSICWSRVAWLIQTSTRPCKKSKHSKTENILVMAPRMRVVQQLMQYFMFLPLWTNSKIRLAILPNKFFSVIINFSDLLCQNFIITVFWPKILLIAETFRSSRSLRIAYFPAANHKVKKIGVVGPKNCLVGRLIQFWSFYFIKIFDFIRLWR